MSTTTGTVDFIVGDETYKTWYQVLGDLKSGARPLVLLHGGPGCPHDLLLGHDQLHKAHSIPIVWYDQLGCGASTHLPDKPKEFWTPELFMDELENLLAHLGIADNFALLGHSWGGMLGAQWAATRLPRGLKRLVIADSPASMALWEKGAGKLMLTMPQDVQDAVYKHQKAGTFEDPEYQAAMHKFYMKYLCRLDPWPETLVASLTEMTKEPTVYNTMNGPDEFSITGTLKTWDIVDILHNISQPTLVLNGRYDSAQDFAVAPYFERIAKAKWVQFSESAHVPCLEEPEYYYEVVGHFLTAQLV